MRPNVEFCNTIVVNSTLESMREIVYRSPQAASKGGELNDLRMVAATT